MLPNTYSCTAREILQIKTLLISNLGIATLQCSELWFIIICLYCMFNVYIFIYTIQVYALYISIFYMFIVYIMFLGWNLSRCDFMIRYLTILLLLQMFNKVSFFYKLVIFRIFPGKVR